MTQEIETFTIPAQNMERLGREVTKLNRRAVKLGQPQMAIVELGRTLIDDPREVSRFAAEGKNLKDPEVRKRIPKIEMIEIRLEGDAPKIEGYSLMGTLDHYSVPGEVIVRTVPGQTIPQEYHNHDASCDHCNKIRRRVETFVLRNEEGEHLAIGRQCVRDFIGYDVAALARFLQRIYSLVESFSDPDDDRWFGGRVVHAFDAAKVLAVTFATIRIRGWRAKSACDDYETPTSEYVRMYFMPPRFVGRHADQDRREYLDFCEDVDSTADADMDTARKAIEWLADQPDTNEYMHNLHVLARQEVTPVNMFGYWCSLAAAYERAMERLRLEESSRATRKNEHVGAVKQRGEFTVTVESIRNINSHYGLSQLHRMIDDEGRTLVWFANTNSGMDVGNTYRIKGTVKKHDEYKGWAQTTLTRVVVQEELTQAA